VHRFVIQRKVQIGEACQRIGRRAGEGHHRHADISGDPDLIHHLFGFAAARHGDKHFIACGVTEKNIAAVTWTGDKRRLSQHLQFLGQVFGEQIREARAIQKKALLFPQQRGKLTALLFRRPVPDQFAVAAKAELLAQPHDGGCGNKGRLRQIAHRDVAHQQRVRRQVGEHAVFRAGQRCTAR